ncbi:carboxypeptidase SOL1 isoform X1 [Physcomitrium patens]|uniref:Peptidase M14 domain-containing protein n=2 Tax=Physcomitrium patens TaxID=3218 RepID=A0A2K1J8I9_PHYPA|nr:carboxypeptidase SOL1-like [Physcomitrium patens]PNR37845.1 hypothetical protein PHYPA_020954 [Physcomitrium patens]|eukprot:XP_024398551.1 carboxypeptidase SOL1-like [Physcomitrella patens]
MFVMFRNRGSCDCGTLGAAAISLLVVLLGLDLASSASLTTQGMKAATPANSTVEAHYKSNLELEVALKNFTRRCRHISRLYTIGNSTLGVPLWALEISDKPGVSEPEPAFKYVGNMHGDEPLGRELVLLLSDWLCDNYKKDPMATLIVDKLHLHLLPTMNPDGFAAQKPGPTRNNAHDVDLNRDFPDQFFPQNNNEEKRQAETRSVMNWIRSSRFTASASFHEGALVANYPYDGTPDISTKYAPSPDDSTFKYLAGVYAGNHPLMLKSKEFTGGITNGAHWYPLYGGMQDWNYLHGNCMELTLEMNENKWPPPDQVPRIWGEHRKSMLELAAATVKSGVHGRVMSSIQGEPLAATIVVSGISHSMNASAEFGDYHRLLAPGQVYTVTANIPGYYNRTTSVFLPNNSAVTLDFILDPLPSNVGFARLRGHGLFDEKNFRTMIPPAEQQKESTKVPAEEQGEKTPPIDVATYKLTKTPTKGLDSDYESGFGLTMQLGLVYVVLLISVAAILFCLFLRSRGGVRYQASRVQRTLKESI